MDELLTVLQLGCSVQLDKRQAVRLGTHIQELSKQNASLFSQLEAVKKQVNDKQLEVEHCHAVCSELRDMLKTKVADALDTEAALILAAPADSGVNWSKTRIAAFNEIGTMMKSRAALARAKAGA